MESKLSRDTFSAGRDFLTDVVRDIAGGSEVMPRVPGFEPAPCSTGADRRATEEFDPKHGHVIVYTGTFR